MNPAQLPDLIVVPLTPGTQQPAPATAGQPPANAGQPPQANAGQPPAMTVAVGQPAQPSPSNVPVYVVTEMNPTGFTFPKFKCPFKMNSTGVAQPEPAQPQPVVAQRTWKRAEVYYTNDGPYPGGQSSGTIVYFDPSQMK